MANIEERKYLGIIILRFPELLRRWNPVPNIGTLPALLDLATKFEHHRSRKMPICYILRKSIVTVFIIDGTNKDNWCSSFLSKVNHMFVF